MNSPSAQALPSRRLTDQSVFILLLVLACSPWGLLKLKRLRAPLWLRIAYGVVGVPLFTISYGLAAIVIFALFLPPLDLSVGEGLERTVHYKAGNYASTFLKTAADTGGAYELIRVEIQPQGGNGFHYHRTFEETFTAVEGDLTVLVGDEKHM